MVPVCGPVTSPPDGMVPQAGYPPANRPQMVVPLLIAQHPAT